MLGHKTFSVPARAGWRVTHGFRFAALQAQNRYPEGALPIAVWTATGQPTIGIGPWAVSYINLLAAYAAQQEAA